MTPRIFLGISTLEDETNTLSQTATTYAVTSHHISEKLYPQLYHCENVYTHLLYSSLQTYYFILKAQIHYTHSLIHSFLGYFFTLLQPHNRTRCHDDEYIKIWKSSHALLNVNRAVQMFPDWIFYSFPPNAIYRGTIELHSWNRFSQECKLVLV